MTAWPVATFCKKCLALRWWVQSLITISFKLGLWHLVSWLRRSQVSEHCRTTCMNPLKQNAATVNTFAIFSGRLSAEVCLSSNSHVWSIQPVHAARPSEARRLGSIAGQHVSVWATSSCVCPLQLFDIKPLMAFCKSELKMDCNDVAKIQSSQRSALPSSSIFVFSYQHWRFVIVCTCAVLQASKNMWTAFLTDSKQCTPITVGYLTVLADSTVKQIS